MRCGKGTLVLAVALITASLASGEVSVKLPSMAGGAVMSPDNKTLIVSLPASGALLYFDTMGDKELKRVELDFQPGAMAIQGKSLFVTGKGSAVVHVLDVATAKETKRLKLTGDPVVNLACHPSKGLLYAVNPSDAVFTIDPSSDKVTPTKARGQLPAMDATDGKFVYAGIQKATKDVLVMKQKGKNLESSFAKANRFALLLMYAVKGADLELVAFDDHAAINGLDINVSPDGRRIAMAGAGGWSPPGNNAKRGYTIAVFDTSDLKTLMGQIELAPYPVRVAFYPHLGLGAAGRNGATSDVTLFNAKSLLWEKPERLLKAVGSYCEYRCTRDWRSC
jgi:DNA-binding beta-propeller fold protein YncE